MIWPRVKIMATSSIEIGETGHTVAENIRRIRGIRRMRLEDVADLMSFHGRKMSKATLSQVENRQRRIDVDDLLVFARVLKVSPLDLLLPPAFPVGVTAVKMTGFNWTTSDRVSDWIDGVAPLADADAFEGENDDDWDAWYRVDRRKISEEPESTHFPNRKRP